MINDVARHYFESHITIDPVFGADRIKADLLARPFNFKLAKLLMQKESDGNAQMSDLDTFMTGHSKSFDDISRRTKTLVALLKSVGFNVRRYKIEETVVDSRINDEWNLL